MTEHYELVLPFDSDDPEFSRGFEVGRLYGLMQGRGHADGEMFHAENAEMVLRIGEALGLTMKAQAIDENWMVVGAVTPTQELGGGEP